MPDLELAHRAIIRGIGAAFPSTVRLNHAWPESFRQRLKEASRSDFTALETAADGSAAALDQCIAAAMAPYRDDPFRGAVRRRVLGPGETASQLEAEAARAALEDAGLGAADVDLALITSHMPDLPLPTNGPALQSSLALERAMVLSVDVACASFVAQWILADSLLRAGAARFVLGVQSCTMSRFVDMTSPLSVHVGDGATAVVFALAQRPGRGLVSHWSRTEGWLREGIVLTHVDGQGRGARLFEQAVGPLALMSLDPASGKRAGIISAQWCREASLAALERAGLRPSEVAFFLGPQSIKWLPEACRLSLDLEKEKVLESFDEVANISSATIPYNLLLARRKGLLREGAPILLYAPGVGMHRAAAVARW